MNGSASLAKMTIARHNFSAVRAATTALSAANLTQHCVHCELKHPCKIPIVILLDRGCAALVKARNVAWNSATNVSTGTL